MIKVSDGKYISFGLGAISKDGKWHPFRRNLQKDLNKFEPNSKILSINAFMIRGSGMVDNIKAIRDSSITPPIQNFDMKKFNELLKENREQSQEGLEDTYVDNTSDEHIKYISYSDDHVVFYTLSYNQTHLKELASYYARGDWENIHININKVEFNSAHTRMMVTLYYFPFPEDTYQYEVLL